MRGADGERMQTHINIHFQGGSVRRRLYLSADYTLRVCWESPCLLCYQPVLSHCFMTRQFSFGVQNF